MRRIRVHTNKTEIIMIISTRGRYALRVLIDLAEHTGDGYITMKEVAARQDISLKYLEQIITQLSRAGLVKSARGAQGGYMLAKEPQEYTVGEILRLLEGNLAPVACVDDTKDDCTRADECVTMEVWREIKDAVNKVVDNITLADLVEQQRQKCRCCK